MKWIPVSENLPEHEGSYLCTVSAVSMRDYPKKFLMTEELEWGRVAPEVSGEEYSFNGYGFGERWSDGIDNLCEVTAWMEMPKPYENGDR